MTENEYYDANKAASLNADFVDFTEVDIVLKEISPEQKVIKQQNFTSLSNEAREVISLVVNTPTEILEVITTNKGKKSKSLIIKYLQKKWQSKFLVDTVISEITKFVKSL